MSSIHLDRSPKRLERVGKRLLNKGLLSLGHFKNCSLALVILSLASVSSGQDLGARLDALIEQNDRLMSLAREQQAEIRELRERLDKTVETDERQESALRELKESFVSEPPVSQKLGLSERVVISGDAGFAFFSSESEGEYPNEEILVDSIRINIEAEIAQGIYLTTQWEPFRREGTDLDATVSEFFVDFENPFGLDDYGLLNFRVGKFQIPFGEEYLYRYTMENPLVTHSVADLWGIDEGVEAYGALHGVDYSIALQNGGRSSKRDLDSSKSIAARFGYDIGERTRVSASFMDTGNLSAAGGELSELWIGNVVFQPIGSSQTNQYNIGMGQLDASYGWEGGNVKAAFGEARYRDDDPLADNSRDFEFFHIEGLQNLTDRLYAAARFSYMSADNPYPFSGHAKRSTYFTGGVFTREIERISLGLGYWASEDALLKLEYSIEDAELGDGSKRPNADQLSAEVGVRF